MLFDKSKYSYEEIYTRNIRRLANYAAAQVHNREDAEELASEAMLVLWRKLRELDIQNPDAYVTQILANLIRNFMRKKQRQLETVSFDLIGDIASEPPSGEPVGRLPSRIKCFRQTNYNFSNTAQIVFQRNLTNLGTSGKQLPLTLLPGESPP